MKKSTALAIRPEAAPVRGAGRHAVVRQPGSSGTVQQYTGRARSVGRTLEGSSTRVGVRLSKGVEAADHLAGVLDDCDWSQETSIAACMLLGVRGGAKRGLTREQLHALLDEALNTRFEVGTGIGL